MISAILLLMYAALAGTFGASWLRDARWPTRAPRVAIAAWQTLAASVLLALAAAGLALAMSLPHVSADLAGVFHLCAENLRHGYASPGGKVTSLIGMSMLFGWLARASWFAVRITVADRHERTARIVAFEMVGRSDVLPGVLVVDHALPYAFCIGGKQRRIIVTSGLLATLNRGELAAVLAHERAHLRQRHHLAMSWCRALFATIAPIFPAFGRSIGYVRMYAEMCADDCARRQVDTSSLRSALARLACVQAPAGTLAASALDVETRLLRLEAHPNRTSAVLGASGVGVAILLPLVLAAGPALALAWEGLCLLG